MRLVLASNSPRRKELLSKLNYPFEIIPSTCAEITTAALPKDMATELANRKALDVFRSNQDAVVIGCDTVVDLDGVVMGKPADKQNAVDMLKSLSGKTHKVHTGVCIIHALGVWLFADTTDVAFFHLTDEQIESYVESGSAFDKAGAYGIQDSGFVKNINGSYDNVVGFPTERVQTILLEIIKGENNGKS